MAEQQYTVASDSEVSYGEQPPPFLDTALGIDIGTSQCSVATWTGFDVELLTNTRQEKHLKSYVLFKDSLPTGGLNEELPHREEEIFSGSAVFNVKRLIGRVDTDPVVHVSKTLPFLVQTLDIGARPFIAALVNNIWRSTTPEDVLAIFLVELKAMAEVQLKRPVSSAVLTIPVAFSRFQQTRIERACSMAGLRPLRLMPEPTAVALLYAQQQQHVAEEKLALIFNMGAGYADVALTSTAGGVSQVKALAGCSLGGEDLLQSVMRCLLPSGMFKQLCEKKSFEGIRTMGRVRIAAQEAIHRLSTEMSVTVNLDEHKVSRSLHRAELEEMNRPLFERLENLVIDCLGDVKVDDVILVGGCSRIPRIRSLVLGLCGKQNAYNGIDPLEAAARGAALEGAIASGVNDQTGRLDLLTIQSTSLSLGILVTGGRFEAVIPRKTAVPARKEVFFTTAHDNQSEALVVVYEGEGKMAVENHLLGYFKLEGIPPAPKGEVDIRVCMDVDASNVLRVLAGVVSSGMQMPLVPLIEVRMPTLDDGHGWCAKALEGKYGSTMDLCLATERPSQ